MRDATSDTFFVGYRPLPRALRLFLLLSAGVVAVGAGLLCAVFAVAQRDPGPGRWHDTAIRSWIGLLRAEPYPMLVAADGRGGTRSLLLVGVGKVGVVERVAESNCKPVIVRGTLLERDGFGMIELLDTPDAIRPSTPTNLTPTPVTERAAPESKHVVSSIRGEIIDPKCHSGAMKPGDGKAHKACATLCVRGGIPPMFLDSATGVRFLLVDNEGKGLTGATLESVLPFVGDPVELTNVNVETRGDLRIVRIGADSVRRQ